MYQLPLVVQVCSSRNKKGYYEEVNAADLAISLILRHDFPGSGSGISLASSLYWGIGSTG